MLRLPPALPLSLLLAGCALLPGCAARVPAPITVAAVADSGDTRLTALPMRTVGRVSPVADGVQRQWPATYFETAFRGREALFRVGAGEVALRVTVDGQEAMRLVRPAPGLYRVGGLAAGEHRVRVEATSESQAGPTTFGGFLAGPGTVAAALPVAARQIEFIGDSHTVGYANTSNKQDCTGEEVWLSTDTSQGIGPLLAARYGADYQVNAISGRGVVRNYDGFAADPLPEAYRHTLFDQRAEAAPDPAWQPQVIVIALGTNDFSTALHEGEPWATREALHADFERSYVAFVQRLRAAHPRAFIVLWATDKAEGEVKAEVARVVAALHAAGEARLGYLPVDGLGFAACHSHPSLADDRAVAERLATLIDGQADVWTGGR